MLLKDKQELSVINTMLSGEERTKGENYVSSNFTRQLVELNFHEDGIYYISMIFKVFLNNAHVEHTGKSGEKLWIITLNQGVT